VSCECGGVNSEGSERTWPTVCDDGPGASSSEGNMASDSASSDEEEYTIWESPSGSDRKESCISLLESAS